MYLPPCSMLIKLPNELLHLIAEHLEVDELYFWTLTTKQFYLSLNDALYARAVTFDRVEIGWPWCLVATVLSNNLPAFKRLLEKSPISDINSQQVKISAFHGTPSQRRLPMPQESRDLIAGQTELGFHSNPTQYNRDFVTTVLHVACHLDREDMARLIIDNGGHPSLTDHSLSTPLHIASAKNSLSLMNLLVVAGADVSAISGTGMNPLSFASGNGNVSAVQLLLDAGADIVVHNDRRSASPLHLAAGSPNSVQVAHLLLQAGADVSKCMYYSGTPLHSATRKGDLGMTKLLLEYGADVTALDRLGETVLHGVLSFPIAKLLVSLDKNLVSVRNHVGSSTLRSLVLGNLPVESAEELESVALLLIEADASLSSETHSGTTLNPIHKLAELGCDKAVAAALTINPGLALVQNYRGLTPLHCVAAAHSERMVRCVKLLIDAGSEMTTLTDDDETALHYAVQGKQSAHARSVVQLLLDAGINVSAQTSCGETALHETILSNNPEIALDLIEAGIDASPKIFYQRGRCSTEPFYLESNTAWVEARSPGRTALHCAARFGYFDVVKRLVKCHIDISATDVYGNTALHLAVREGVNRHYAVEGYVNMVALILLGNHDASVSDVHGQTSLHDLSSGGYIAIIRQLIASGADPTIRNSYDCSALDIACRRSQRRLADAAVHHSEEIKKQVGPRPNRRILRWLGMVEENEIAEMESLVDLFGGD